jgi:GT2 family glycosyltransferase
LEKSNPKVLISILNWNAPESTCKTVASVLLSEYTNYSIVLLDNNSSDNSVSILKEAFPELQLIKTRTNLGYAGAHKIAAKMAMKNGFDLLWILNNDVEVYSDSLQQLVCAYHRNGESLLGSVTLNTDELTINFGGGLEMLNEHECDETRGYNIFAGKRIDEIKMNERPVSGIQGSSFLLPLSVIKKFGFMSTRFFLYGEETEYCYHLRKKYNIQTILVPASRVVHHGGVSFKKNEKLQFIRAYYATRNGNLVHKKYQKENEIVEMNFRKLPYYIKYFVRHFFITDEKDKDFNYWIHYYTELGNFHSLLRIKGKYLAPEKLLD